MNTPPWITVAKGYLGIKEIPGPKANQIIVDMFNTVGFAQVKDDETAWCAAFLGHCLVKAGLKSTGSLWALDYKNWGTQLNTPVYGSIAWKTRKGGGGHVGFVVGATAGKIFLLGGNQNNSVSIAEFKLKDIGGYRWPIGVPVYLNTMPTSVDNALKSVTEA